VSLWSPQFLDLLDGNPTEGKASNADGQYAPRFRLILGNSAFHNDQVPNFEVVENVFVAYSHALDPAGAGGFEGIGSGADPSRVCYIPHALGRFSISPQEVAPRSWSYSAPQFQCEISPEFAAVLAKYATPGSLMKLGVNLNGETKSGFMGKEGLLEWSDIYFGQYRNLTYSGGRYSITCRGFYEAAIGAPSVNRDAVFSGEGEFGVPSTWGFGRLAIPMVPFHGVGSKVLLRDSWDGTDAGTTSPGATSGLIAEEDRGVMYFTKGFGQRRTDKGPYDYAASYSIGHTSLPFYGYAAAHVKPNTTGSSTAARPPYIVSYGVGGGSAEDLKDDFVHDTWLKGADDRSTHKGYLGNYSTTVADSELSSRVFLNGNPAVELVTMLYSNLGWTLPWFTMARLFSFHVHRGLVEYAARAIGANVVADDLAIKSYRSTLCAEIKQPANNIKSFIDSTFGPIGVFPVFKTGCLGVNVVKNIHTADRAAKSVPAGMDEGVEGTIATIRTQEVERITDIKVRASGMETAYQKIKYSDEGKCSTATASVVCGVSNEYTLSREIANPTEPLLGEYHFKAGAYNTIFPNLIANDFKCRCSAYWKYCFGEISLKLRSLKYAYLSPGDIVYLDIDREGIDFSATSWAKIQLGIDKDTKCMIIRHGVDWLSGTVSITVLKEVARQEEL